MRSRLAEIIRKRYPVDSMSPEEYAARFSRQTTLMPEAYMPHEDEELARWMRRVQEVREDFEQISTLRKEFLSPEEYAEIEAALSQTATNLRTDYPVDTMSPQEWVGRNSHRASSLSYHRELAHNDQQLHTWMAEAWDLMKDVTGAHRLRERYLSPEDFAQVDRELRQRTTDFRSFLPVGMEPVEYLARTEHKRSECPHRLEDRCLDPEIQAWKESVLEAAHREAEIEALRKTVLPAEELEQIREQQRIRGAALRERLPVDTMSPEEFVARHSHGIMCFSSSGVLEHGDPELADWLYQTSALLSNWDYTRELRKQYLTPEELAQVERELEEDW